MIFFLIKKIKSVVLKEDWKCKLPNGDMLESATHIFIRQGNDKWFTTVNVISSRPLFKKPHSNQQDTAPKIFNLKNS